MKKEGRKEGRKERKASLSRKKRHSDGQTAPHLETNLTLGCLPLRLDSLPDSLVLTGSVWRQYCSRERIRVY
jgi:hypothetical protein